MAACGAVRLMVPSDMEGISLIEAAAYPSAVAEGAPSLQMHFQLFPDGCFVCLNASNVPCGYVLSCPWKEDECPMALGEVLCPMALGEHLPPARIPQDPDTMYIHDLCVHPDAASSGHGGRLYSAVLGKCQEIGLLCVSITSVCGSQGWWQKKGFRPVEQLSAAGLATLNQSYSECEGAVVMQLSLPSEPIIPDEATISDLMFMPAEFPRDGHAHEIVTGLFLGDRDAAINAEQLGCVRCMPDSE